MGEVGAVEPERYRILDLDLDVVDATVSRKGRRIALPPRTFDLFLLLVRRHPHLVRRQEILDAVWPDEHVTEQTLSHRVLLLRHALGDRADEPRYVAGERGFGYRLIAPVERLDEREGPRRPGPVRRVAPVALALALLLAIALHRGASGRAVPAPELGVKRLSSEGLAPEMQTLAADLTDALQARLARLEGVRVRPWPGTGEPPLLWFEGHVRTADGRLEVSLSLVERASGRAAWSRSSGGKAYEVLIGTNALLESAAQAAAERLGPPAAAPPPPAMPSARVRRLCLRGEFHWLAWGAEAFTASRRVYEQAIALAPAHSAAHAGLSLAACGQALAGAGRATEAVARTHAARAMELDPREPSALLAAGLVRLLFDWDAPAAASQLRLVLDAAPGEPTPAMGLALAQQALGRFDESVSLLRSAAHVEPDAGVLFLQGRGLAAAGRCAEAAPVLERALRSNPRLRSARIHLAECLAARGSAAEAGTVLAPEEAPGGPLVARWRQLCVGKGAPESDRIRACVHAGELDRAAQILRSGLTSRAPFVVFVPADPLFASPPIRSAFGDLIDGLPAPGG